MTLVDTIRNLKCVVFAAGGMRGLSFAGAWTEVENYAFDHGIRLYDNVHTYVGCSIGSLMAMAASVGFNGETLEEMILEQDFSIAMQDFNLPLFTTTYGICNIEPVEHAIGDFLQRRFGQYGANITFSRLHRLTGKRLVIAVTDVDRKLVEYWDHTSHPDTLVVQAISASIRVPVLYGPLMIPDKETPDLIHHYADGGLVEPFPFRAVDEPEKLGFDLIINKESYGVIDGPKAYLLHTLWTIGDRVRNKIYSELSSDECNRIIPIDCKEYGSFNTSLEVKDKQTLIKYGRESARNFLRNASNPTQPNQIELIALVTTALTKYFQTMGQSGTVHTMQNAVPHGTVQTAPSTNLETRTQSTLDQEESVEPTRTTQEPRCTAD